MSEKTDEVVKFEELFVVLGVSKSGVEGVVGYIENEDGVMKPLVGGSSRFHFLVEVSQALADASNQTLRLAKFSSREDLSTFTPRPTH